MAHLIFLLDVASHGISLNLFLYEIGSRSLFLKKWANPGLFLFILVIFSLQFQ